MSPRKKKDQSTPNRLLRQARLEREWTQQKVAEMIGVETDRVSRWENGNSKPSLYAQRRLCEIFDKKAEDLGFLPKPLDPLTPIFDPTIPEPPPHFIGHQELMKQMKQYLCQKEVEASLVLKGLPGVGKTAIATMLAHDKEVRSCFADGILWTGLGPAGRIREQWIHWGYLLGMQLAEMAKLSDQTLAKTLCTIIGSRRMLLVIDDAWQTEDVLALKIGGPHCSYLITTRVTDVAFSLKADHSMHVQEVPELNEDEGVLLLSQLAPEVVQADPLEARSLVNAVMGLPLSLTLIGKNLYKQSQYGQSDRIRQTLERLHSKEERIKLSWPRGVAGAKDPYPGLAARTPLSLQAVIGISDEALGPIERQVFRSLSSFPPKPSTFSQEAALVVASASPQSLNGLIEVGLLEVKAQDRYTLHQTIADYASVNRGEDSSFEERMAIYFTQYLEEHESDYLLFEQERMNVLAALDLAYQRKMETVLVRGAVAVFPFLEAQGFYDEAETQLKRAEEIARPSNTHALATILLDLGRIEEKRGNWSRAKGFLQEGITIARKEQYHELLSYLLQHLGQITVYSNDIDQAEEYLREGLTIAQKTENTELLCELFQSLGTLYLNYRVDLQQAEKYYQKALVLARNRKKLEKISVILENLGIVAYYSRDYKSTRKFLEEALEKAESLGHRERICAVLENLGWLAVTLNQYPQAINYLEQGLLLARQVGQPQLICGILTALSSTTILLDKLDTAKEYALEGLEIAERLQDLYRSNAALQNLGEIASLKGEYEEAERYLKRGLAIARQLKSPDKINSFLAAFAELFARKGDNRRAEAYYENALQLAKKRNNALLSIKVLCSRGEHLYLKHGFIKQATRDFDEALRGIKALEVAQEIDGREEHGLALYGLARICASQGKMKDAYVFGQKSFELLNEIHFYRVPEVKQWLSMFPIEGGYDRQKDILKEVK